MPFRYPLTRPALDWRTYRDVFNVLRSGYLTEGPVTKEFEQAIANYVGVPHAIAVTSATTGLELVLRAWGIGPGDEVIVPDYTHPATADVVRIVGATVVLVDIRIDNLLIDYAAIEKAITPQTRAIIPVSQFGNPLDYPRLNAIAKTHNLVVIEDAACSIGATHGGTQVGTHVDAAVFSFHPRKFITTGEGGAVVTKDAEKAAWMRSYKAFGADHLVARSDLSFAEIGTNYKLSNILSAVGLSQMRRIESLLAERMAIGERYNRLLAGVSSVTLPLTTASGQHAYQTYSILIRDRDRVLKRLRDQGIEAQIGTFALHLHPAFAAGAFVRHAGTLELSTRAFRENLALPVYPGMRPADQEQIVRQLQKAMEE